MSIGPEFDTVLSAAKTGDGEAIATLYRALNPLLLRYFKANARGVAEDLAQEVWLGAAPRLGTFEGDEHQFRTWLFTVARRRLVDHWRASGRRVNEVHDTVEATTTDDDDPAARIIGDVAIAELTAGLTDEQREVMVLRVVGGLSVDEVAAIIDKTPGAVRVIQHRAVRKAAARLNEAAVTK
jgi:RNA polymerase sigma-70 factor (ECF subfamily)